jgi:hypothetical protein
MADTNQIAEEHAKRLRESTDEHLAVVKAGRVTGNLEAILADQEMARRDRLKQHELDVKLIADQVRWMKFSTVAGVLGTIVGAIIGALLTYLLQDRPSLRQSESQPRSTQQESVPSTTVDRTEKAESVPSKTP